MTFFITTNMVITQSHMNFQQRWLNSLFSTCHSSIYNVVIFSIERERERIVFETDIDNSLDILTNQ